MASKNFKRVSVLKEPKETWTSDKTDVKKMAGEKEKLRPSLNWGEALLFIKEQKKELSASKALIERLVEAINGLACGTDWNNGTHAILHGYREKLLKAGKDAERFLGEGKP